MVVERDASPVPSYYYLPLGSRPFARTCYVPPSVFPPQINEDASPSSPHPITIDPPKSDGREWIPPNPSLSKTSSFRTASRCSLARRSRRCRRLCSHSLASDPRSIPPAPAQGEVPSGLLGRHASGRVSIRCPRSNISSIVSQSLARACQTRPPRPPPLAYRPLRPCRRPPPRLPLGQFSPSSASLRRLVSNLTTSRQRLWRQ